MEAQFQKGRCPGCMATGTLLVETDHSIGCDRCQGLWEIEDLLRIISPQGHQSPRLQPVRRIRCTRPDWGDRLGWAVIIASTMYFAVRILPPLLFNS